MAHGTTGVVGVVLLLSGCAPGEPGEVEADRARPTVYVDADAPDGGDGSSWQDALQTVEEGVAAACDLGGRPTVQIAPGEYHGVLDDPARDEKNILVRCPMTIRGRTVFSRGPGGLPTDVDPEHPNYTRIAVALQARPAFTAGDSIFRIVSSDVTVEGLVLDGGDSGGLTSFLVDVGGYPQTGPAAAACPSGPLDNVNLSDLGLFNAGQSITSANSNTSITGVYATGNLIGVTLLGGHEESSRSTSVWRSTLSGNDWYGACVFGTASGLFARCPPAPGDTRPTTHEVLISESDLSLNGYAPSNNSGAGLRIIALGSGQPDAPDHLDVVFVGNTVHDNFAYGIVNDMAVQQVGRLTSPIEHEALILFNDVSGSGRNDGYIGFRQVNGSLAVPPNLLPYATHSRTDFVVWPELSFDYDHPAEGRAFVGTGPAIAVQVLGNAATVNGDPIANNVTISPLTP